MSNAILEEAPLRRKRRRIALTGGAAAAAIALGIGGFLATSATFTASNTVEDNSIGVASLVIGEVSSTPIAASNLLPGQEAEEFPGILVFTNGGTVDFSYTVEIDNLVTDPVLDPTTAAELLQYLELTITSGGQTASGSLANPAGLTITVPSLAPGQPAASVDATVTLNQNAPDELQGLDATFDVVVTAEQIVPSDD